MLCAAHLFPYYIRGYIKLNDLEHQHRPPTLVPHLHMCGQHTWLLCKLLRLIPCCLFMAVAHNVASRRMHSLSPYAYKQLLYRHILCGNTTGSHAEAHCGSLCSVAHQLSLGCAHTFFATPLLPCPSTQVSSRSSGVKSLVLASCM